MTPDMEVVDTVEPEMETETVEDIDDMSDEEFNETLAELTGTETDAEPSQEASEDSVDDNVQDVDLDGSYRAQMDDTDGTFDKPMYLKINGEVMEVSNINDIKNLAELGAGANKAFQKIAADTKTIDFMKDNGLSIDDLHNFIKDKGLEPQTRPEADVSGGDVTRLITQIEESPINDDFLAGIEMLPIEATNEIGANPDLLADLANEFESGYAQQIMPYVKKEMAIKNMSFVDAYKSVGLRKLQHERKVAKVDVGAVASQPRAKQNVSSKVDVDNMSTADFQKYIDKMR